MALQTVKTLQWAESNRMEDWGQEYHPEFGNAWMELMPRVRLALNPDVDAELDHRRDRMQRREEEAKCHFPDSETPRNEFWLLIQKQNGEWERDRPVHTAKSKKGQTYCKIWSRKFDCWFFVFFPSHVNPLGRTLAATLCKEVEG